MSYGMDSIYGQIESLSPIKSFLDNYSLYHVFYSLLGVTNRQFVTKEVSNREEENTKRTELRIKQKRRRNI